MSTEALEDTLSAIAANIVERLPEDIATALVTKLMERRGFEGEGAHVLTIIPARTRQLVRITDKKGNSATHTIEMWGTTSDGMVVGIIITEDGAWVVEDERTIEGCTVEYLPKDEQ